jgi:molybdenum cofactor biosynthesis enzyme MoaA
MSYWPYIYPCRKKLPELHAAGLDSLNVSLDTLVPDKFEFISRRPKAAHAKAELTLKHSFRYYNTRYSI